MSWVRILLGAPFFRVSMYTQYHLCLSDGVTDHTLVYDLATHRPAQLWAEIMASADASTLRKNFDPWHGVNDSPTTLITRLLELVVNLQLPVTLPSKSWDNNLQELLNRLHIHFPELEKQENDIQVNEWLTEFNDTIHKIEDIERNHDKFIWLNILPDSGHEHTLVDSDYTLFSASRQFGDLCLHYPHVGRHLLEVLKARDFDCPPDQIVTQHKIKAYHSLRFYEDIYSETEYRDFLKLLLDTSPLGEFYDLNDPTIAFGYINMGKLRYTDKAEIIDIIKNTHFVKDWKIIS